MQCMNRPLNPDLPRFVSFGEALTDLVRIGPNEWRSVCGGAPWNVAMAMAAMGELSAFAGSISSEVFGQAIWDASVEAKLDLRFIQRVSKPPLLAVVHETDPPDYFFVGHDSADLQFRPESLPVGWIRALRWAHFGSLSLTREPLASRLVGLAESLRLEGKHISYDPNFRAGMDARYDETLERMSRLADVIKVSDEDLCGLFRCADPVQGLSQICAWNPDAWILRTRGAAGATLYRGAREWSAAPPKIDVMDTVGAGDAALAGLVHTLMQHPEAPGPQRLRWAVGAGAAACTTVGAQAPQMATVTTLAQRVVVQPAR
jgi:fructokinase